MSRSSTRGPGRPATQLALQESETARPQRTRSPGSESAPAQDEAPAGYSVALLRIALLLKLPDGPGIDEAISRVADRMALDEAGLREWITTNTGLLQANASDRAVLRRIHPMD